ncbi:uncharacterized protein MKZ38_000577 [Zalerion maritima]|uniref:Uncharacterized protein n=1 Tax=Zalerion maritima TaxID=339359 RepID=A0AAD5RS53_9PEZI|nr:uncharacterized protein MKZ38_000577 [Zalerion maritima]
MTNCYMTDIDDATPASAVMAAPEPNGTKLDQLEIPTAVLDETLLDSAPSSATSDPNDLISDRSSSPEFGLLDDVQMSSEHSYPLGASSDTMAEHEAILQSPESTPSTTAATSFLSLPAEVRLQVYNHVYLNTPIPRKGIAAWYPTPAPGLFVTTTSRDTILLPPENPTADEDEDADMHRHILGDRSGTTTLTKPYWKPQGLLNPYRPYNAMPSSLLRTCKTIYKEAAPIPWEENEFCFINWLSGGVLGGNSFLRRRDPWQLETLRWLRLESYVEELVTRRPNPNRSAARSRSFRGGMFGVWTEEATVDIWIKLCQRLRAVRGLRLLICERTGGREGHLLWDKMDAYQDEEPGLIDEEEWRGPVWVLGLRRMPDLKAVEIQNEIEGWDTSTHMRFCSQVERLVNHSRPSSRHAVTVKAVERLRKRKETLTNLHQQT